MDPDVVVSPSDLAERSGVTRATITGLLDGLTREKLVSREDDTGDRRKAVVRLTSRGRKTLDGILPEYYRHVAELMGELSDDEKATLVKLLTRVNQRVGALWTAAGKTGPRTSGDKSASPADVSSATGPA